MEVYKAFESSVTYKFPALLFLFFITSGTIIGHASHLIPTPITTVVNSGQTAGDTSSSNTLTTTSESSRHAQSLFLQNVNNQKIEGQLHIVAVMAEFQPDDNPYTSGNGTFGSNGLPFLDDPSITIDPLPHNQTYFEARLEFVKNYFERMSNGALHITYQVLPQVHQLPGTMADYSPIGMDPDLSSMASFAADVWSAVDVQLTRELLNSTADNTLFVIFHAGVGRDIELTGTTLTRTPQDLPSLYLDRDGFRELLDDPSFSGFPIGNGENLIDNTLILPRTLSREGEDLSGAPYVLQLSTNGLATALTGSHLGLPSLFHTETGRSGIGRFGLMDGASMFSYRGLFPPEMSAWEKLYAGWADSFTLPTHTQQNIKLPAASMRQPRSFLKISISGDEYFLIENRHRDPDNRGVTLTIQRPDGSSVQQTFTNADTHFTNQETGFEELLEAGVITSVSNYDFSLPGGLDSFGNRELNGGILIWHIDEALIREKIGTTGINNNEQHRGITLKEADGAQDIGRPVSTGFFQNEINGSAFDFWWSGNDASVNIQGSSTTLYQNRFSDDTFPNNRSHSGTPSNFELSDFSDTLPVATFTLSPDHPYEELYSPIPITGEAATADDHFFTSDPSGHLTNYPPAIIPYNNGFTNSVLIPSQSGLFLLDLGNNTLHKLADFGTTVKHPLFLEGRHQVAVASHSSDDSDPLTLTLYDLSPDTLTAQWQQEIEWFNGFLSQTDPAWLDADHSGIQISTDSGILRQSEYPGQSSEVMGSYRSALQNGELIMYYPGGTASHTIPGFSTTQKNHTGMIRQKNHTSFYLIAGDRLSYYSEEDAYRSEQILSNHTAIGRPAIVDLHQDGNPVFIYIEQENNQLVAKNISGGLSSNFPISAPSGNEFIGTPLVADIDGDGHYEIIISTRSAYSLSVYAYNLRGEVVPGFPISGGSMHPDSDHETLESESFHPVAAHSNSHNNTLQPDPLYPITPHATLDDATLPSDAFLPIHPAIAGNHLVVISPAGELNVWEFPELTDAVWQSAYGNRSNQKISAALSTNVLPETPSTLLEPAEIYNWPNPASDHTYLRVKTTENAEITIKIITLSGQLIYDNSYRTLKGVAQDIEIDTKRWSSGGYIGLITAESGQIKEQKRIPIAIVK